MKNKVITYLGRVIIIAALMLVALRSYTIDVFSELEHRAFLAPAGEVFSPDEKSFSFAVMGDSGAMDEVLERIIRRIRKTDAKFVLYLGDLVRYRNPSHFKWIAEELDEELRGIPFYMVPGNHEVISENKIVDRRFYNEMFGQTYYWFAYGDTLFIGLDSAEERIDEKQLKWLENVLKTFRSSYKYCIIFSHVPPVTDKKDDDHKLDDVSRQRLAKIVRGNNINLLLAGHVHYYSETSFAGVPLITTPSSGQIIRSDIKKYGYVEVKVSEKEITCRDVYYDKPIKDKQSTVELFFSSALVKKGILKVSLWMMVVGCILLMVGRKFNR